MDKADIASEYQQMVLDEQISKSRGRFSTVQESSDICVECGQMIPDERRKAVPGVDTCVHCREIIERSQARGRAA